MAGTESPENTQQQACENTQSGENPADICEKPRQAIILAAGQAAHLRPYTDEIPTALITIADQPMIAHSLEALRKQGVDRFLICRGWQGEAFNAHLTELGDGVTLVDCPDYANTGMLETFRLGMPHLRPGGFYVAYGDIIFKPSVARQLSNSPGPVSIVVNAAAPGNESKGTHDVEVVITSGEGAQRTVRRIGKGRCASLAEAAGEFGGMIKFSAAGRELAEDTLKRIFPDGSSKVFSPPERLPWWLQPVKKASLCDLLQLLADEGTDIGPAMIYGGWHEVNTPQDLTRACNDTAMFMSEADVRAQVSAMGACFLSEANDLKRPLCIVAKELNVCLPKLECLLRGDLELGDALEILQKMSEVYPVPLNDLWLDADDTTGGVRLCKSDASEASARILNRPDRTGERTPYYEYRDCAMSRFGPFRPEWIKELRLVTSGDPMDPDVALNHGHLMMQTTLFIGPVDFYWKDRHGVVQRREMNTGDSNFISSFVPHSFSLREEGKEGIIIAVTYGGKVRKAFTEFSRIGASRIESLAGDKRDPMLMRRCILKRHLDAECLSPELFAAAVAPGISEARTVELLGGQEGSFAELELLAKALNVQVRDLLECPLEVEEEVVVTKTEDSQKNARRTGTYVLAPLARTRHQSDLKTFDLEVLDSARPGDKLCCGLHSFVYHFGTEPVELTWQAEKKHTVTMAPGDSAYIAPLVEHSFAVSSSVSGDAVGAEPNGRACATGRRLFVVRIPGHLSGETLSEFATFSAEGRERVGAETKQWYS